MEQQGKIHRLALIVGILAVTSSLPATESKPDDGASPASRGTDSVNGKEPGEVRDDNSLKLKLVWCPRGKFKMGNPPSEKRGREVDRRCDFRTSSQRFRGGSR